jgi:hypothetical protein
MRLPRHDRRHRVVALAAVVPIVMAGCGGSGHSTSTSSGGSKRAPTSAGPTVASCVSAWNAHSSSSDRQELNVVAAQGSSSVAVATYAGPTVTVGQVGPGADIPVRANACLVIAGTSVFVQQANGSWLLSEAILTRNFSAFANPATSEQEANAEASTGIAGQSDVGLLTSSPGSSIVTLTPQDVGGAPASSGSASSTTSSKVSARPLAIDSLVGDINNMIDLNGDTSGNASNTSSCILRGSDGTVIAVSAPVDSPNTDICIGTSEKDAGITWTFLSGQPLPERSPHAR